MAIGTAIALAGLGMQGASMLSDGSSGGASPSSKIELTERAKGLEKVIHGAGETRWQDAISGKLNSNLVSPIIGQMRRNLQAGYRNDQDALASSAARTTTNDTLQSGNQVKAGIMAAGSKADEKTSIAKKKHLFQREGMQNALNFGRNIMNIEMQTPMLQAQSMYATSLMDQGISQQQGQTLGSIAQFGGMMGFNNARTKYNQSRGY